MSLGNYPLVNPVNPSQNSQGLNNINTYYSVMPVAKFYGVNSNYTSGTFNCGILTTGTVKILFCYVTGLTITGASSTTPQITVSMVPVPTIETNAYSLVRVENTFPTNEQSAVVASGDLIPFNGSETTEDNWIQEEINALQGDLFPQGIPADTAWKNESLEYTSGGTNAVYSYSIAQNITDPETNQLETGLEESYETAPDSAYVNTFNPETNDVLAFDEAAGEAQWVPAEDLEPNPQAIQQIQAAAQLPMYFAFLCGAVIFQPVEPDAAGITVSLAQTGTAPAINGSTTYESTPSYRYDSIVITATQDVSNISFSFIMIGV
jgi:hypothetical protein